MKNRIISLTVAAVLTLGILTGCGQSADPVTEDTEQTEDAKQSAEDTKELEKIKVGACVTPHAEILSEVKEDLAEKGYDLEVVEYNDYVLPNQC